MEIENSFVVAVFHLVIVKLASNTDDASWLQIRNAHLYHRRDKTSSDR